MKRTVIVYGVAIAIAALALQWLDYQYTVKVFSTEAYVVVIAGAFTVLGLWVGQSFTNSRSTTEPFEKNIQAISTLGISDREMEVLESLAEGLTNKEIAKRLLVSPNTVKTHLANLYGKLDIGTRVQAIQRARELRILS